MNQLFYSRSEEAAIRAQHELFDKFPEVIQYFNDHVFPIAHKLFASLKPDIFFFNHSSSQLAESYNNMIKRDMTNNLKHLFEIRDHITNKFQVKSNLEARIRQTSFAFHHYLIDTYKLPISKHICQMIDLEFYKVKNVEIIETEDKTIIAKEGDDFFCLNFENCQCYFTIQSGIPCCHLMALYQSKKLDFPVHLINQRFFLTNPFENNIKTIAWNFKDEEEEEDSDYVYVEECDQSDEEFFEKNAENEIFEPYSDQIFQTSISRKNNREANYYIELLQIAKDISKIGSSNTQMYQSIKEDFLSLRNKYMEKTQFGEVIGRRRGRPKLKKFSKNSGIR